jgi:hypothetical protein
MDTVDKSMILMIANIHNGFHGNHVFSGFTKNAPARTGSQEGVSSILTSSTIENKRLSRTAANGQNAPGFHRGSKRQSINLGLSCFLSPQSTRNSFENRKKLALWNVGQLELLRSRNFH